MGMPRRGTNLVNHVKETAVHHLARVTYGYLYLLLVAVSGCTETRAAAAPAEAPILAGVAADALASPQCWFRASAQYASAIEPSADAGILPPRRAVRQNMLAAILQTQAYTGDVDDAVASAIKYSPEALAVIARAQAGKGDAAGALATARRASKTADKQDALRAVVEGLIYAEKLADAQRILKDRGRDELTGSLYAELARAQAKAGDIAAAQVSIKAIAGAPEGDGLNVVRSADAYVAIAAAQARAGDLAAYRDSLAKARQMTKGFRPPYEGNTLVRIADAQAAAGDYDAATATLAAMDPAKEGRRNSDMVLVARLRRGDVTPADALAEAPDRFAVLHAVIEKQLAAKEYKAAAQTCLGAKGTHFFYEMTKGIADGFLDAGDADGATAFAEKLSDPGKLYGYLAARRAEAGDRAAYATLMGKAVAIAAKMTEMPAQSSIGPVRTNALADLVRIQMDAKDFDGAKKTVAEISLPEYRVRFERDVRARELAATGRLEEARNWVLALPEAEDRAEACRQIAVQLLQALKSKPTAPPMGI
jgi:hypothetical protein